VTTAADQDTASAPRTYGNWRKPRTPGLPRLGLVGTVVALTGLIIVILVQMLFGLLPALVTGGIVLIGVGPIAYRNRAGRNGWQIFTANVMWLIGTRKRQNLYRSGIAGPIPYGSHKLPGLLSPVKAYEAIDVGGAAFGLLHIPSTRHYSVVLACEPEGAQLVDDETVDTWVALWGRFLAEAGVEPGLEALTATVETAPDPGSRLGSELGRLRAADAPPFATAVLDEIESTYARGAARVSGRVTITWTAIRPNLDERPRGRRSRQGRRSRIRTPEEMAAQIGNRLPDIVRRLSVAGLGSVRALPTAEVAELVHIAYHPSADSSIDAMRSSGEATGISWDNAGPAALAEDWDQMRHDSGTSVTWQMVEAPRGAVQSQVLRPLLEPAREIARKRVTLVFRPHTASEAARVADADVRTALGRATARKGEARAADTLDLRAARQAAAEEASGAGMSRFSLLVSATVLHSADLAAAVDVVEEAAGASRLSLRRCYAAQSASFAAALGVGIVLNKHVAVPDVVRMYL
jgi:hypothetical protein